MLTNSYRLMLLALIISLFPIGCGRPDRSPLSQAKLLLHEDKFADAQKVCDELLAANPETDDPVKNRVRFEGLLVRGQIFQEAGDLDQAQADYSAAIALEEKNPDGYYFRSKLFRLRSDEASETSKVDEAEAYDQASMDDYRLYTKFDPEAGIAYPNDFESKPTLLESFDPLSEDPLGNEQLAQDPVNIETPEALDFSRFGDDATEDTDEDAEAFNAEAMTNISDGGKLDKVDPSSNTVTVNKPKIALDELRKEQDEIRRKIAALDLQSDLENAALLPHKDPQAADDQTVIPKPTTPITRFDRPVVPQPNATNPTTNFPPVPRRPTTGITSQQQPNATQPNTPRNGFGMRNRGTGNTGYGGSRYGGSGASPNNGFGSRPMGFQQPYNSGIPNSGAGFSTIPPSYGGTSPASGRTTGYISDGGLARGVRQSRMLPQQFGNTGSYFAPQTNQNRQPPNGQSQTQAATTPGSVPGVPVTKPISSALPLNVLDGLMNGTPIPPFDPLPR